MSQNPPKNRPHPDIHPAHKTGHPLPLRNYTLATVCPACNTPTYRHACKVCCPRCGFIWDCSEI